MAGDDIREVVVSCAGRSLDSVVINGDLGSKTGRDTVDRFFEILVDIIPVRENSEAEYLKWAEATQPLGFEGVTVLEEVTAGLLDRARDIALGDCRPTF